jgi:succinate dehydrogenase / fumarate reductase iron-sulfur subunit
VSERRLKLTLKIWRQDGPDATGRFETFQVDDVSPDQSFLEMLDELNFKLIEQGREPVSFESDCREGICGCCGLMINGQAHGPLRGTTTCELYMRHFDDRQTVVIEPWRAKAFPVVKDLIVDRTSYDQILMAGGYVSIATGNAPEANSVPVPKENAERAMDAAACIGCGACVAACPNASAMLFVGAKVSQLALLPQGQPERKRRALNMVRTMDALGFGNCTNHSECEAACPKEISVSNISRLNRELMGAAASYKPV